MRMRHKKNLEPRLEAVKDYYISPRNVSRNYEDAKTERHLLDFEGIFGNANPVYLEVGGGKGQFACTFAQRNPDYNIICVEKVRDVMVSGCELAQKMGIKNILFMDCEAEYLPSYIPEGSIEGIFLNFSCPFPKSTYAHHRLTHKRFLDIYKPLMKDGAVIEQKTDNMHFFEFSIESFSQNGFVLSNISLDLHASNFEGNIETEYEQRFSSQGFPIYRLEARIK
jgi:tRNA (guanine-N7-)-methyltransferase